MLYIRSLQKSGEIDCSKRTGEGGHTMRVRQHQGRFYHIALIAVGLILVTAAASLGCTSVFVGKDASATGNPIIARMEDGASAVSKYFVVSPARKLTKGETETFFNGLTWGYPEDMKETLKFFSLPDFCYMDHSEDSWDGGLWPYSAAGINSEGVSITATETEDRNQKSHDADPPTENGIEECMIVGLILPRARTAREGVQILGDAIEKFGSAEDPYNDGMGEIAGLAIADQDEVWYVEYAGHQWAAIRVPDDSYVINGNESALRGLNVKDAVGKQKNAMASPGVFSFAVENQLPGYEDADEKNFDFARAYGNVSKEDMATYSAVRFWWGQKWFTPSVEQEPGLGRYPFLMKPDKPITKEEIIAFFRSEGYPKDMDFDFEGYRPVSRCSNMEAHIIEMGEKGDFPWAIGTVMWLSLGPAMDSVYLPFHGGVNRSPAGFTIGTDVYDQESASWAFRSVSALARQKPEYQQNLRNFWNEYQQMLFTREAEISEQAMKLWKEGKEDEAIVYLTDQDVAIAEAAVKKARELEAQLITALAQDDDGEFAPTME